VLNTKSGQQTPLFTRFLGPPQEILMICSVLTKMRRCLPFYHFPVFKADKQNLLVLAALKGKFEKSYFEQYGHIRKMQK